MKSGSNLEKVLSAGKFAVTGELGPPRGGNADAIKEKAQHLKGMVDAVNITDNQTAVVRMASWAASVLLMKEGLEPNYQMVCRDRNRIAMQSDILGAHALGIRNMLCLSGDHQLFGDHPKSKKVFDIDSIQLISMAKKMRDEGKFLNGEELTEAPKIWLTNSISGYNWYANSNGKLTYAPSEIRNDSLETTYATKYAGIAKIANRNKLLLTAFRFFLSFMV